MRGSAHGELGTDGKPARQQAVGVSPGASSAGTRGLACGATRRGEAIRTAISERLVQPAREVTDARSAEEPPARDRCAGCADTDVPDLRAGHQGDDLKQHRYRKDPDRSGVNYGRELAMPSGELDSEGAGNDSGPEDAQYRPPAKRRSSQTALL